MSRIGIQPITVPDGVTLEVTDRFVLAKGPKGENKVTIPPRIRVLQEDKTVKITRQGESGPVKALHGLVRSLVSNAVVGVADGFTKTLEIQGVGYRAKLVGENLELTIGFSHLVTVAKQPGISFQVKGNKVTVVGFNKGQVGEMAASIRRIRPPDAYKGKGIRYEGEIVRLKPGKAAKAAGAA